jgi:hypothetical protein
MNGTAKHTDSYDGGKIFRILTSQEETTHVECNAYLQTRTNTITIEHMFIGQTYFDTYLNEYKGCNLQVQFF